MSRKPPGARGRKHPRLAAAILALLTVGALATLWTARQSDARLRGYLLERARLAAQAIDVTDVTALAGTPTDLGSPAYLRLKRQLALLRQAASDCRFTYVAGQRPDGMIFFHVDSEPVGSKDESPAGQTFDEAPPEFRRVFATGSAGTDGPVSDRWGTWVSAFVPLRAADGGGLVGVFGMDVDARDWRANVASRCLLPGGLLAIVLLTGSFSAALFLANRRLRASREQLKGLESIVARGPMVLFLWRIAPGDWPVELVSDNVERVFGLGVDDLVAGRVRWSAITHPEDAPRLEAEVADCLARGVDEWSREYRLLDSQKRIRWVRDWSRAVRSAEGEIDQIQAIVLDVTDEKRAEADKIKLQAQLVQAQKMELVGRLAGGVAHDFNNLLMGIMAYVHLCLNRVEPDHPIRAYLNEITADAERSADLIRQLLAFARKQIIAPTEMNLNAAVEAMLNLLRRLVSEAVRIVWSPGPELWRVKMDRSQLEQLLGNLVVNARDAITGQGTITIETANAELDEAYCADNPGAVPGEHVRMTVSDNGCGMEAETLSHLFEPFFTTKELGHGTGLGLATVYGIVKQNQGFIKVCSEPWKGTAFKVYLPRCADAPGAQPAPPAPPPLPRGTETILLAEDETCPE